MESAQSPAYTIFVKPGSEVRLIWDLVLSVMAEILDGFQGSRNRFQLFIQNDHLFIEHRLFNNWLAKNGVLVGTIGSCTRRDLGRVNLTESSLFFVRFYDVVTRTDYILIIQIFPLGNELIMIP